MGCREAHGAAEVLHRGDFLVVLDARVAADHALGPGLVVLDGARVANVKVAQVAVPALFLEDLLAAEVAPVAHELLEEERVVVRALKKGWGLFG